MSTEATPSTSPGFRVNGLEQQINSFGQKKQNKKKTLTLGNEKDLWQTIEKPSILNVKDIKMFWQEPHF